MADPGLRLMKNQETGHRLWIGALDGLLNGFDKTRGSSEEQLEIASMQIVEFVFEHRRTGLLSLRNRMKELKAIENPEMADEKGTRWKKGGDAYKLVRGTFQTWRKQIKAHKKTNDGNMDGFIWPPTPDQAEVILQELLAFASSVLQYSAVDDWCTVDAGNATYMDDKFTKGIIDAFWMGHVEHKAWLAQNEAWTAREAFEQILVQASGISFAYPDGVEAMDDNNEYAVKEDEMDEDEGYFGTFNKHVIQKNLADLRIQQTHCVEKIIQLVKDYGSVRGVGGEPVVPKSMKTALKSFFEARKSLLVHIYVPY